MIVPSLKVPNLMTDVHVTEYIQEVVIDIQRTDWKMREKSDKIFFHLTVKEVMLLAASIIRLQLPFREVVSDHGHIFCLKNFAFLC